MLLFKALKGFLMLMGLLGCFTFAALAFLAMGAILGGARRPNPAGLDDQGDEDEGPGEVFNFPFRYLMRVVTHHGTREVVRGTEEELLAELVTVGDGVSSLEFDPWHAPRFAFEVKDRGVRVAWARDLYGPGTIRDLGAVVIPFERAAQSRGEAIPA